MINVFNFLFILILLPVLVFSQNEKYPIPQKTDNLLFYIQRNHNANTIIYDVVYDKQGKLNNDEPIVVYWRRYEEQGQTMELRTIEKWYAYGVDWEEVEPGKLYKIELVANKEHIFMLKQISPFSSAIITKINNEPSVLDHIYIFADNSGTWPTVEYIELFGRSTLSNNKTYEKLINK